MGWKYTCIGPINSKHPWFRSIGFTLLELLVVIAIIGLLTAYVGPRYFSQIGKAEVTTAKTQMQALARALDQYRLDTGHYPNSEQGLNALMAPPGEEAKWNGPYLQSAAPPDPWGKPYIYRLKKERADFELLSYGKDGLPGGTGEAEDLSSR